MATVRQDPSGLFLFRPGEEIMEGIERGQEKKKRNRLAQLAQQAVTAGAPQQEQLVAEAVGVDPEAGFALGKQTRTMEKARNQRLGRLAMILTEVPESQRPQLYQQMLPELTRLGLQAPPQYTPEVDQTAMRLAAVLGGGEEGAGRRVQSTFINESGELVGVINDPTAPNGIRLVNTGEYADPRMRFFQPESGAPALVAQRGRQAGRATEVTLEGGAPPAADPDQLGALFTRYESMVGAGIPEEQARGWLQQQLNQAGATLSPGFDIPGAPVESPSPVSIGVAPSGRNPLAKMSPAERAAAEAEAKAGVELRMAPLIAGAETTARGQATQRLEAPQRAQGRAMATQKSQNLRSVIGEALDVVGPYTAGVAGYARFLPETAARTLSGHLDTIRANVGFEALQQLRDASPTGGALGNVSERENLLLQSTIRSLDQELAPAQLRRNLEAIQAEVEKSWERVRNAYEVDVRAGLIDAATFPFPDEFKFGGNASEPSSSDIDELLEKYR